MVSMAQLPDNSSESWNDCNEDSQGQNSESSFSYNIPANSEAESAKVIIPRSKRILVVDDDSWVCDVIARVLVRHKYFVSTAPSGEHALDLLLLSDYDLVISDMMLSGITGLDLTTKIVEQYPHLPVILITAHSDTDLMKRALREGASDFIPKPFNIETVPMVVERNLERHALAEEQKIKRDDNLMFTTVHALAAAIDAKEPFTAEHSRRVAALSLILADGMGLSEADKQCLELAAQVHDVGKIGVPDFILNKPGKLNEEEWQAMLLHPVQGAEMVGRVKQLATVAEVIRHHHERIDGTGYPDGLKADEIPLLSRMISVVDAFEVMTSDRVYRTRCTKEAAFQTLIDCSGTQFDSAVVQTFIKLNALI